MELELNNKYILYILVEHLEILELSLALLKMKEFATLKYLKKSSYA